MSTEQQQPKKPRRANADGSVFFWKGRGWYAAVTGPDGRRVQRKAPKQTEAGAERLLRQLLAQRDAGELTGRGTTLAEFKEDWLRAVKLRGCRPRTLDSYRDKLETHVLPTLGRKRLDKLTAGDLERLYARKLEEGLSPASIAMVHANVHNLLKLAKRRRLVGQVVTELVDPPKVPRYTARTLSIAELGVLFRAIDGHRRGPFGRSSRRPAPASARRPACGGPTSSRSRSGSPGSAPARPRPACETAT